MCADKENDPWEGASPNGAVIRLKLVLLAVLVTSAVGVAVSVYYCTSTAENKRFEDRFVSEGTKVLEAVGGSLDLSLSVVDTYVVGLVGRARTTNQTFPFVTLDKFPVIASKISSLSGVFTFIHYYFVTADQREEWEEYSVQNDGWVQEALDTQKNDPSFHGKTFSKYNPYGSIHGNLGPSEGPGPFLPAWQSYPVVPVYPPYNWDISMYSSFRDTLPEIIDKKRVVIGKVPNIADPNGPAASEASITNDWAKDYIATDEDPAEPMAVIYYPIVDGTTNSINQSSEGKVVGVIAMTSYWRTFIKNILPPGSNGIVCVFENECGQSFTYEIQGAGVSYLGPRDLHDGNYDYIGLSSRLGKGYSAHSRIYTGAQISEEFCSYSLHVYPSSNMEDFFTSVNPAMFAVVTVLIFAFTSALFIAYDRLVTRRLEDSNRMLEAANRSVVLASKMQLQHFASMSHEIRTPLNCITGMSSLLLSENELNPKQQESARMIVTSGDLLLTVVNDVLDYSKLESGNVDIEIKRSNLQETLTSVVHSIEAKGQHKNIIVRTIYDVDVPEFINTDTRRLQQILYNLLGNSIKFSNEGGTIELRLFICFRSLNESSDPAIVEGNVQCDAPIDDKVLRFIVKDYGKGIAKNDFEKIFEPFRQAGEDEQVYGGTGLGLAITAKLVGGLGGSISVDSEEGKWTAFTVDIPFDGVPANSKAISAELKDCAVFLVGTEGDDLRQIPNTFRHYKVDFERFVSMRALEEMIASYGVSSRRRSYVYLIQEDLFVKEVYKTLSKCADSVLLTFGPKYSVNESQGHYRSLSHVLPSVLIRSMGAHVSRSKQVRHELAPAQSTSACVTDLYRDLRILIAEDNVVNQKVLSRILQRLGVSDLEIACNGKDAVYREASRAFDLVLMDMQMPVMDGVSACRLINERQGGHQKAKVIFITAHVADSFEAECLEAGAVGYLAKPCKLESVDQCIRQFVLLQNQNPTRAITTPITGRRSREENETQRSVRRKINDENDTPRRRRTAPESWNTNTPSPGKRLCRALS